MAIKQFWLAGLTLLMTACGPQVDIALPASDGIDVNYPIGVYNARGTLASTYIVTRYGLGKPLLIYLPEGPGPFPTVVFQHGRPFVMPDPSPYNPPAALVDTTISQGYALAVVVREGYFGSMGRDVEVVPCDNPDYEDFAKAGEAAAATISEALAYLRRQSFVDSSRLILAGSSAGGFAALNALQEEDYGVVAAISINGGRCGNRGNVIGGLGSIRTLYQQIGNEVETPVIFLYGGRDTVIPRYSSEALFMTFCRARTDCIQRRRTFLYVDEAATHEVESMMDVYRQALVLTRRL